VTIGIGDLLIYVLGFGPSQVGRVVALVAAKAR
jgi:hypothetical protein